jgi:hypothetical protein
VVLKGDTNIKYLQENGENLCWADANGELVLFTVISGATGTVKKSIKSQI